MRIIGPAVARRPKVLEDRSQVGRGRRGQSVAGTAADDAAATDATTAACPHRDGHEHPGRGPRVDASRSYLSAARTRGGMRGGGSTGGSARLRDPSRRTAKEGAE